MSKNRRHRQHKIKPLVTATQDGVQVNAPIGPDSKFLGRLNEDGTIDAGGRMGHLPQGVAEQTEIRDGIVYIGGRAVGLINI